MLVTITTISICIIFQLVAKIQTPSFPQGPYILITNSQHPYSAYT